MINFDSLTLKAQLEEIAPILSSGRIQKIQQPARNEILLGIRALGKNYKLYINADPKYPHLSLLTEQGEEYRGIEIPQTPPMFCMLLRKHMEGAKIKAVKQPNYERILEIYFDSYNELGDREPLILACEFMGKYSNIILYSYDTNIILGCAHNVSSEKSRERELAGGLPYTYPPKPNKINLLDISEAEFLELSKAISSPINVWLNEKFHYISLALATEFCKVTAISIEKDKIIATSQDKISKLYHLSKQTLGLENLSPSISRDHKTYSLIGQDPEIEWQKVDSVNSMVDLYFGYHIYLDKFSRLKTSLQSVIKKEIKKQRVKYSQHQKVMENEEKAEKYREYADILMANLYKIQTGQESVTLENYYDNNKAVIIPLDSSLSASANAQRYYRLYNKTKTAAQFSENLLLQIQSEIEYLESILVAINQSESLNDLKDIQEELEYQHLLKATKTTKLKEKKKEIVNLAEYTSSDNLKIYMGRNNRQNDYLVSKLAAPDDIWLHTQNIPGSHVLIKSPPENIPDKTLLEAANLAAYFSQARDSSNVPVIYTKRRFLKKPPGAKPGYVTYSHEKTLFVNPDENLVKNLI